MRIDELLESTERLFFHLQIVAYYHAINPPSSTIPAGDRVHDTEHGEVLDHHWSQLLTRLGELQRRLLENAEGKEGAGWIVGSTRTIADLIVACRLLPLNLIKTLDLAAFQPLVEWVDRLARSCGKEFFRVTRGFGTSRGERALYGRHTLVQVKTMCTVSACCNPLRRQIEQPRQNQDGFGMGPPCDCKQELEYSALCTSACQRVLEVCVAPAREACHSASARLSTPVTP